MKKITSLLLAAVMLAALCVPASAAGRSNFKKVNTYVEGQFTDVPATSWCAANVRTAYEYGIMGGKTSSYFDTDGNLTIAQTIVMACRLHNLYYGHNAAFETGDPWYQFYVAYALQYGIITREYNSYNSAVSRAGFAMILGAALPDEALPEISSIEDGAIPDVPSGSNYYDAVYRLSLIHI